MCCRESCGVRVRELGYLQLSGLMSESNNLGRPTMASVTVAHYEAAVVGDHEDYFFR